MGLVRLAAFVMQSLTADPRIANRLNEPVNLRLSLRGKYNVPGTLADFLIVRSSLSPLHRRNGTDAGERRYRSTPSSSRPRHDCRHCTPRSSLPSPTPRRTSRTSRSYRRRGCSSSSSPSRRLSSCSWRRGTPASSTVSLVSPFDNVWS